MLSHGEEKMKVTAPAAKAVDNLIAERDPNSENTKSPSAAVENDSECNQHAKEKVTTLNHSLS